VNPCSDCIGEADSGFVRTVAFEDAPSRRTWGEGAAATDVHIASEAFFAAAGFIVSAVVG
jgi:hypothetical protein